MTDDIFPMKPPAGDAAQYLFNEPKITKVKTKKKKSSRMQYIHPVTNRLCDSDKKKDSSVKRKRRRRVAATTSSMIIPKTTFNTIGANECRMSRKLKKVPQKKLPRSFLPLEEPKERAPIVVNIDLTAATSPVKSQELSVVSDTSYAKADVTSIKERLNNLLISNNRHSLKVEEYSMLGKIWDARNKLK